MTEPLHLCHSRREFLAGAGLAASACRRARRDARPNVVFILTDDQRWDAMSCVENGFFPALKTPHIDWLAAEGVRFTNAFVTTSLCSPSRASLLSGRYAHRHGVMDNFTDFPADVRHYPAVLREGGYDTAYIGKWHMGEQSDEPRPGFNHWVSHRGQGEYFDNEFNIDGRRQKVAGYYTDRVTEMAVEWMKRPRGGPFLLILGHKASHTPFTPAERHRKAFDAARIDYPASAENATVREGKPAWVEQRIRTRHGLRSDLYGLGTYDRFLRSYYGTLLGVDESVGEVYGALRRMGELDNTLLVFAGDNGYMLGEHSLTDKRAMYEESIRIPLLMRYPAEIKAGTRAARMALNIDLAPTILDLAGAPPLEGVDGRSLRPLIEGRAGEWRESFYYEYFFEKAFPFTPRLEGVRTTEWKYVHAPEIGDSEELYNLKRDPEELINLARNAASREKLAEMKREMARYRPDDPKPPAPRAESLNSPSSHSTGS